jgi:uncharacterized protein DUF4388
LALEGSLRDFGLADILQLIFFQRKTGVLSLEGKLDKVKLLFIDGNISGAESKRRMEANRLGKVLVKKGVLSEEDLQSVLDEQRSTNVRLGNLLVRKGISKKEDVEEVLTGQIKETVIQIFGWKEGTYEFTPQAVPVDKDIPISIDSQHLLMEGLRIVDEWALIEGKITLDAIFTKKTGDTTELSEEEKDILLLIDGENDVSTIIDISGQDDFSVSKTLLSLLDKDVIEPKEVLPVVTETLSKETGKSAFFYRTLPLFAVIGSILLALFSVSFTSGSVFKRFRASEAIDAIRFEIEAYRFEHGSYPDTLDVISKKSDPWGRPYIYEHNNYTFIVLSAGADGREGTPDDIY